MKENESLPNRFINHALFKEHKTVLGLAQNVFVISQQFEIFRVNSLIHS